MDKKTNRSETEHTTNMAIATKLVASNDWIVCKNFMVVDKKQQLKNKYSN